MSPDRCRGTQGSLPPVTKGGIAGALRVCSAIFDLTCSLQGVISLCQESPELKDLKRLNTSRLSDVDLVAWTHKPSSEGD